MGRPPRVLQIGNIANNAYLNAKILRRHGVEVDVCSPDYYHIMGCPEWEDADLPPARGSHFYPRWSRAELAGFQRPEWFAQGPAELCRAYLQARAEGRRRRARLLAARLSVQRYLRSRVAGAWLLHRVFGLLGRELDLHGSPLEIPSSLRPLEGAVEAAFRVMEGLVGLLRRVWALVRRVYWLCLGLFARVRAGAHRLLLGRADVRPGSSSSRAAHQRLPESEMRFIEAGAAPWRPLLEKYDAVIGYATDGWIPFGAGYRPYLAYEHGTIRHLPFQATLAGRLCRSVYEAADEVFVTNCDNVVAARRLCLQRFCFVPHPVNEDWRASDEEVAQLRAELQSELNADFLIFHPSRHHWEGRRHPDWEKANDVLIHGIAQFVRDTGRKVGGVFVDWGATVAESRTLLDELGLGGRIRWVQPLPHRTMVRYVRAADVVADQFFLGAFGSTTPKALYLGTPVLLYLDETLHRWCFDEMPPILNARTPAEVRHELGRLAQDPDLSKRIADQGRDWYRAQHSNERIGRVLLAGLERASERAGGSASPDPDAGVDPGRVGEEGK